MRRIRRMFKRKSLLRVFGVMILCYLCYLLGVFTHLLEKDFSSEFRYPYKVDIKIDIKLGDNAFKYLDMNKHDYQFLYDSKETCKLNNKQQLDLVILVKSKLSHFEQRDAIRATWGSNIRSSNSMRLIFLLGIPSPVEYPELERIDDDEHHQIEKEKHRNSRSVLQYEQFSLSEKLRVENERYGDIVQQNFHDTYYNNTLKAIMGLQWIDRHCANGAKYFLFIDDDYYLNPRLLISYLRTQIETNESLYNNLYAGFVFENSSPMRHRFSKWYISLDEYPYDKFPPYVSAGCYILTDKSARSFYKASQVVTTFRFDDIYLGILSYKLNITPFNIDEIYFYPPTFDNDDYVGKIIASHGFTPDLLKSVWERLYSTSTKTKTA